jgi:hypothetical protein
MGTQKWRRANMEICTITMIEVMQRLRASRDAGQPFTYLDDVHGRTICSLIMRDWIVRSIAPKGEDRPRYSLTGRGSKALQVYEIPSIEYNERRFDGICSRCCEQPLGQWTTGRKKPYCNECMRKVANRKYALFGRQTKLRICPDCNKRQVHITASGHIRGYCRECERERSKEWRSN